MAGKLNPQITTVEIGVRSLKEVTIYPLSMSDQFDASDLITAAVNTFISLTEKEDATDIDIIKGSIEVIQTNLKVILDMVTGDDKISMDDLTNDQFSELVTIIFEVNYEGMLGNFKSLFAKAKGMFRSKRPLQTSLEQLPIEQSISSSEVTGTEV